MKSIWNWLSLVRDFLRSLRSTPARKWLDSARDFIRALLSASTYQRISQPDPATNPRINMLLLRGLSWLDDDTYDKLSAELDLRRDVNQVWFSYRGLQEGTPLYYTPEDVVSISIDDHVATLAAHLNHIISQTPDLPITLTAFSFGGLVTASFLCTTTNLALYTRLKVVCLLGTPMFPPYEWIHLRHPQTGRRVSVHLNPGGKYNRRLLFTQYPNDILNVIGSSDSIAPEEYASLKRVAAKSNASSRLNEQTVPGLHRRIPKQKKTLEFIQQYGCLL